MVLSLWRDNVCAGSFRLAIDEVPALIEMLRAGLVALLRVRPRPAGRCRVASPRGRAVRSGLARWTRRRAGHPGVLAVASPPRRRPAVGLAARVLVVTSMGGGDGALSTDIPDTRYRPNMDPIRNPYAPGRGPAPARAGRPRP